MSAARHSYPAFENSQHVCVLIFCLRRIPTCHYDPSLVLGNAMHDKLIALIALTRDHTEQAEGIITGLHEMRDNLPDVMA